MMRVIKISLHRISVCILFYPIHTDYYDGLKTTVGFSKGPS